MIAQVWKKQSVLIKENLLRKYQIDIEMKNKKPIPKNPIFFEIDKTLKKQTRLIFLLFKHFWKLLLNTKKGEKF